MEFLFAMTLPGLVIGLIVLGVIEVASRRGRREPRKPGAPMSSIGFDLIQEVFNPAKRVQIEQREHEALMYEEDGEGSPPRTRIDLDKGTAHVVLPRD